MKRADIVSISSLILIALAIYYPLFYQEYLYTDEAVQLWLYKKGTVFQMFLPFGRYITDKLFYWLFSGANSIQDIIRIRLFSLVGWLLSIPVWYYIIKKVVNREKLPALLPFFSVLYLICSPPFTISVAWASCLELFLANTAGLLSGYFLYSSIKYENNRIAVTAKWMVLAVIFGVISLFTYQNGFGCFFLPFVLYLLANPGKWRTVFIGVAGYFFICIVYYLLFKYSLSINHIEISSRASLHINVMNKMKFFFGRALSGSFHFTYLFNEKSIAGIIVYILLFGVTMVIYAMRFAGESFVKTGKQITFLLALLVLTYLPSLIVKENYSSNRTLLALNMAVFLFVAAIVLNLIKKQKTQIPFVLSLSIVFVCNAWYNLNKQFLQPVTSEYKQIRAFIDKNYAPGIDSIFFIRPAEDLFVKKYRITRSWDEFGVPSTFFEWTPEFFVRQVVFEKTGNRQLAEKLVIENWLGEKSFGDSGMQVGKNKLLVNAEKILEH
jgi:hypothetical protein